MKYGWTYAEAILKRLEVDHKCFLWRHTNDNLHNQCLREEIYHQEFESKKEEDVAWPK